MPAKAVLCFKCKKKSPLSELKRVEEGSACPACGAVLLYKRKGWRRPIPAHRWKEIQEHIEKGQYGFAASKLMQRARCSVRTCDAYLFQRIQELDLPPLGFKTKFLMVQLKGMAKLGFHERVVATASKYEDDPPRTPEFDYLLATSLRALGQRRRAVVYYRNAYLQDPKDDKVLNDIAELLIDMGHTNQAKRYIQELTDLDKDDSRIPLLVFKLNKAVKEEKEKQKDQ